MLNCWSTQRQAPQRIYFRFYQLLLVVQSKVIKNALLVVSLLCVLSYMLLLFLVVSECKVTQLSEEYCLFKGRAIAEQLNTFFSSVCRTAKMYYHLLPGHILFQISGSKTEILSNLYSEQVAIQCDSLYWAAFTHLILQYLCC